MNGWIDVNKYLPEAGKEIWVILEYSDESPSSREVWIASYKAGNWWCQCGEILLPCWNAKVTHWQPANNPEINPSL